MNKLQPALARVDMALVGKHFLSLSSGCNQFIDANHLVQPLLALVSYPASLSHAEKESGETRIQFWFHTYVTYSDTGTMNVIISDGAITV